MRGVTHSDKPTENNHLTLLNSVEHFSAFQLIVVVVRLPNDVCGSVSLLLLTLFLVKKKKKRSDPHVCVYLSDVVFTACSAALWKPEMQLMQL